MVILIGLGVWALDRWSILPIWPLDPLDCVPVEASIVLSLPEMDRALGLNKEGSPDAWVNAIKQLPGLSQDIDLINALIDTLFPSRTVVDRTQGLLSIDALSGQELAGTWVLDLRSLGQLDPAEWFNARRLSYSTASFRGDPVWTVNLAAGRQISVATVRNLLVLARRSYQVEAVLAADINANNWVKELRSQSDPETLLSIYCNTAAWVDVKRCLFNSGGQELVQSWESWLRSVRLDLIPEAGGYRLQGDVNASDGWLNTGQQVGGEEAGLWGLLPNNTAALRVLQLNDYAAYFRRSSGREVGRFQRFFLPWLSGPVVQLVLRPFDAGIQARQLYFLSFNDLERTTAGLNDWMEEVGILQTANYQGFTLTQVQEDQSPFPPFGNLGHNPWWTMLDHAVVLAADRRSLENWIDQYAVDNMLPLTEVVRQLTPSEKNGQFAFFLDWKQWRSGWRHVVHSNALADALAGLGQLSLRVDMQAATGSLDGLWQVEQELKNEGDLAWRKVLGDEIAAGPWCIETRESQPLIAVQDRANTLYLLDGTGKVQWQNAYREQIISPVRSLLLKTGPALVFNSANAIYLTDMEGKAIAPFPISLRNPTALAVTAVDFSADKNYNFFVITTDGCAYGYDLDGGAVPAWNPKCQLGEVGHPILHFQDENRDFLVVRNSNGYLRAFARDGSMRQEAEFPEGRNYSDLQLQLLATPKQVVSCTDSGVVQLMPLDGASIQFRLPVGNNEGVQMVYENFQGDQRKDYLLYAGRDLCLHTYTAKGLEKQFEKEFPKTIDQCFAVPMPGGEPTQIGVLLSGSQRIYILNSQGETLTGFPLAGSTPFFISDLFQAGEKHLIVGYQDEVLAYRLP